MITKDSKIKVVLKNSDKQFDACPVGVEIPSWLEGAPIEKNADGTFDVGYFEPKTKAIPGQSCWYKYGETFDGSPEVKALSINDTPNKYGECAIDDLSIVDDNGTKLCSLRDFTEMFEQALDSNLRLTPEEFVKELSQEQKLPVRDKDVSGRGSEFDFDDGETENQMSMGE